MGRISNGWNVDRARQEPFNVLVFSSYASLLADFEQAATEAEIENRLVKATTEVGTISHLRRSAWDSVDPTDGDGSDRVGLVFIDLQSPDAHELLHRMRTTRETMPIPVVIITDGLDEADLHYTISHGVTGYFLNPIDPIQLRKVVRDVQDHCNLLYNAPCAN